MKLNVTAEEAQKLTMEKFSVSKSDVSYITEEYLAEDFIDEDLSREFDVIGDKRTASGYNVAYVRDDNGDLFYLFHSSRKEPCGTLKYAWPQSLWNHYTSGKYCGEIEDFQHEIIRFESI